MQKAYFRAKIKTELLHHISIIYSNVVERLDK